MTRPLKRPSTEAAARSTAAYFIEQYLAPRGEMAAWNRVAHDHAVADREYQWTGFHRRVAELLEGDLWAIPSWLQGGCHE